ncbi:flavoprotein [Catenulispora subtropica]|uniref:Flavoprotein n=1 Tax=Catenulispora subtropica TaxID=450798 RepID=A0ABN2QLL7_9ACTN
MSPTIREDPTVPVLYLIACGAPPAAELLSHPEAVPGLQADGWTVCVLCTPSGERFLDPAAVSIATGYPVRVEQRQPGEPDVLPSPDAILVAPLTFNTVNKWALGISDTLALGILNESLGSGLPIAATVWAKEELQKHPAFDGHAQSLFEAGVRFIQPEDGDPRFPWGELRAAMAELLAA